MRLDYPDKGRQLLCLFTLAPVVGIALAAQPSVVWAAQLDSSLGALNVTKVIDGLTEPWGLGFLPDGSQLVTERGGRLLRHDAGGLTEVTGLPPFYAKGQGGLLDILVPRDFAQTREIWLSYATAEGERAATAVGRGTLSPDHSKLEGFETLWRGDLARGGHHFGARLAEAPDGTIYIGTGDRGTGPVGSEAQLPEVSLGKVIALSRSGTPVQGPAGWLPGGVSLGHRNIQGASFDSAGQLWVIEHGARGGDELNAVRRGANYGWPLISYGVNYSGAPIGIGTKAPGMEQPVLYWDPSIAPSGLLIYEGDLFPEWRGNFFVGSLKFGQIHRLDPKSGFAEEILKSAETARVRDIRQGPDGSIWFLSVGQGAAFQLTPGPVK